MSNHPANLHNNSIQTVQNGRYVTFVCTFLVVGFGFNIFFKKVCIIFCIIYVNSGAVINIYGLAHRRWRREIY